VAFRTNGILPSRCQQSASSTGAWIDRPPARPAQSGFDCQLPGGEADHDHGCLRRDIYFFTETQFATSHSQRQNRAFMFSRRRL
jgi:hypothetical protein